jgi:hypothetical protein
LKGALPGSILSRMAARWASFGVGLWLMLAPLVLGYGAIAPVLHGVLVGLLVCIVTLAAFEWPEARFAVGLPALWLAATAHLSADRAAAAVEVVSSLLLALLSLVPSVRRVPHGRPRRAGTGA